MRWSWFFCGVFFLLAGSYMDNARGPLFPSLSQTLNFDYAITGKILVCYNLGAFACTMTLIPATNRWSLSRVSIIAASISILLCLSTTFVQSISHVYVWTACLGGCCSVMGALSNLFTQIAAPPKLRGRALSAVHAMYGLASFVAPLIVGEILQNPDHWRLIYTGAAVPLAILLFICVRYAPRNSTAQPTIKQAVHLEREHWLTVCAMIFYVAGEVITSMWLASWLVGRGYTIQQGAIYTSLFFFLMALTRLLCAAFVTSRWVWTVIWCSLFVSVSSFTLGRVLDLPWLVAGMGFLGPFFPLFMSDVTIVYPNRDRTIIIWILSTMQGLLALMNLFVGELANQIGLNFAYWLAPMMIGVSAAFLFFVRRSQFRRLVHVKTV